MLFLSPDSMELGAVLLEMLGLRSVNFGVYNPY
jgi:hypothetical protein